MPRFIGTNGINFLKPTPSTSAAVASAPTDITKPPKNPFNDVFIGLVRMEQFDDHLPKRKFDNFQFVNYNKVVKKAHLNQVPVEIEFAVAALQEIPDQYNYLKRNNKLTIPQQAPQFNFVVQNSVFSLVTRQTQQQPSNALCTICYQYPANAVLYPCGHTICFDGVCKQSIRECPFCRVPIQNVIKIYS